MTTDATARASEIARSIRSATLTTGALGVLLSPIPLADELVFIPVYGFLAARIARSHDLAPASIPWRPIALTAIAGLGARAAINVTVSYIPFVAAAANAASAVALTRFFGKYVVTACENAAEGRETSPLGLKEVVEALKPRTVAAR